MNPRPCPRCGSPLGIASIAAREAPRQVSSCGVCGGLWLGREDIQAIALALHDLPAFEVQMVGKRGGIASCLGCGAVPYEFTVLGVPVDVCLRCNGAWLDGGELRAISPPTFEGDASSSQETRNARDPYRESALRAERRGVVDCATCQRPVPLEESYVWQVGMLCKSCFYQREPDAPADAHAGAPPSAKGFAAVLEAFEAAKDMMRQCSVCGRQGPARCGHEAAQR